MLSHFSCPHRTNDKRRISASFGKIVICGTRTSNTTHTHTQLDTTIQFIQSPTRTRTYTRTLTLIRCTFIYCRKISIHRTFGPVLIEIKDDDSIKIHTAAKKFAWLAPSMAINYVYMRTTTIGMCLSMSMSMNFSIYCC